ncbi:MAG: twin-arginine translocase TatA/TatE family subunit [Eggerthellaceae bacterium]|nr:twin-arginine translocase TatA/TatE family subunit [Eggerthellaceae bacterium]
MFGIGGTELIIILIFAFLVFGPDKMPDLAKTIGGFLRKFQKTQQEVTKVVKEDLINLCNEEEPIKDPTAAVDKLSKIAKDAVKGVTSNKGDLNRLNQASKTGGVKVSAMAKKAIADRQAEEKQDGD